VIVGARRSHIVACELCDCHSGADLLQPAQRWLMWSLIAALAGMLVLPEVGAAAPAPATLTAVPAQGAAGSILSLTVTGMQAGQVGTVWLDSTRLARFRVDRHGGASASVRVPRHGRGAGTRARGRRRAYRRRHIHDHEIVCVRSSAFAALSTGESISLSPTRVIAGSSAIRCDRISAQCGSVKRGWAEGRSRCGERIAEARCARRSGVLSLGQLGGCSPEVGRRWAGAPR
jgi:hypothetical protein